MGLSEHNRGIISSLIEGKMLNFGMEIFFYLILSEYYNQVSDIKTQIVYFL